jgi:hypothetical protein
VLELGQIPAWHGPWWPFVPPVRARGETDYGRRISSGVQLVYRRANVADDLASSIQQERTLAAVAGAFAVGIALLTAVGLHAFCSYVSAMRTKELAIRAGLGATSFRLATSLVTIGGMKGGR